MEENIKVSELTEATESQEQDYLMVVQNGVSKKIKVEQIMVLALEKAFPVGSRYITDSADINPSAILGFGTWERFNGKIALGVDDTDENMNTIGQTGGEKTHQLIIEEMPSHVHNYSRNVMWVGEVSAGKVLGETLNNVNSDWIKSNTEHTGGNQPHNNMPPYEVVGYMWIRRA